MTAVLAIVSADGQADDALVTQMMSRMSGRGIARTSTWREGGVVLAVGRHEWELGNDFSGPVLIVQDGDLVVAADASLYYRDDLRRKLADKGVHPKGQTASHLILGSYQAFGERCAEILEGDFSFVIWDRKARHVLAARDFGAKRSLHYAHLDSGRVLVVASTVGAILQHPKCTDNLDPFALGCTVANLWSAHDQTCYSDVKVVPAAHTLTGSVRSRVGVAITRHWTPPAFRGDSTTPFELAADELRELLCRATAERLGKSGTTAISMSGGADSPAVFACGQNVLGKSDDGRRLLPVSISYPVGDPGREDDLIHSIAQHWHSPVHWMDSQTIPIFDRPEQCAATRDEPFAHAFEMWNRALAAGSRSVGAHITLDGNGGDQLFHVSSYYLADLLRAGAFRTLRSQWRMKGFHGLERFWGTAVQPLIPRPLRSAARRVGLNQLVESPFERSLPPWIDRRFAERHALLERERCGSPKRNDETCAAFEARWFLTHQYFPRVFSLVGQFALENDVESRSPLYDQRLVSFAAGRPRSDRTSGRKTKQLLRRAMRGLLPDEVLAPRPFKTGLTNVFFEQGFSARMSPLAAGAFDDSSRLAALDMVDVGKLREAVAEYERSHDSAIGICLFQALQAELWLRARDIGQLSEKQILPRVPPVLADETNAA
jgi:asparagine synthase (glutamine-hydrolysing)